MEEFFKKEREFEMNHKVLYFLRELYYNCTYRLWYKVTNTKDEVKWAWQRVFRGYDDTANWDLGFYIAKISTPVLRNMVKNGVGYPSRITSEEWNKILLQIAQGFEDFTLGKNTYKEQRKACELFGKWLENLWD